MTAVADLQVTPLDLDALDSFEGRLVTTVQDTGKLDQVGRRLNRLTRGALQRFVESEAFAKMGQGDARDLAFPAGLSAQALQVIKLNQRPGLAEARKAGVAIGKAAAKSPVLVAIRNNRQIAEVALGAVLRAYSFADHKSGEDSTEENASFTFMVLKPEELVGETDRIQALAEGIFFTRDLTNEPSNILTTSTFAERLQDLSALGLKVEVLEEAQMEKLGMGALLGVGQGSESPSKIVVMEWSGTETSEAPFAVIGKGVVFDTGGISLKPAGGMEGMTVDMGGAGVVAGVMKSLALRRAKANVVGLVGLVENMPDGKAQRPGDVVTSMKGDTIEVINTDAEGRLVLADVMWYAQDRFKPRGMVDLATLTGAMIIALGHENAGVFSNDDALCTAFLKAARAEGEGAWRMPLAPAYDKLLKSNIADMKNVGGGSAGSITAAHFLERFVKDSCPWIHMDIAGVASLTTEGPHSPKGATGWGVLALNRMIDDIFAD